jgi:hypothetical protein
VPDVSVEAQAAPLVGRPRAALPVALGVVPALVAFIAVATAITKLVI